MAGDRAPGLGQRKASHSESLALPLLGPEPQNGYKPGRSRAGLLRTPLNKSSGPSPCSVFPPGYEDVKPQKPGKPCSDLFVYLSWSPERPFVQPHPSVSPGFGNGNGFGLGSQPGDGGGARSGMHMPTTCFPSWTLKDRASQ